MLTALGPATPGGTELWRYRCHCGAEVVKLRQAVTKGTVRSCGCMKWRPKTGRSPHCKITRDEACILAMKYRAKGWSWEQVRTALGVVKMGTVLQMAQRGRLLVMKAQGRTGGLSGDYPDRADAHKTRCKCGLSLPCYKCVPSIWELASSRSGVATGEG
jgi:hypothetical protein